MINEKNNEYAQKIKELEKKLKEELEEDEVIDYREYEQQNIEIENLKKEINKYNISYNINDDDKYIESKAQIIDKCYEDIMEQLNFNSNKYNDIFNKKIEEFKKNIIEQTNAHINEQFEEILNEIKKTKINKNVNEIIEDKNINLEEIKDSGKKNNKVFVDNNNRILNKKKINRIKNDNNISSNNSNILNESKNNESRNSLFNERKLNKKENDEQTSDFEKIDDCDEGVSVSNKINQFKTTHKNNADRFINKPNNLRNIPKNNDKMNPISLLDKDKKEKEIKLKGSEKIIPNNNNKARVNKDKDDINNKIYQNINNIFFIDYQQKNIKDEKINDLKKDQIKDIIFKDKKTGKNIIKKYYMNFIEVKVLPLFKKNKDNSNLNLEAIKYNISTILECLGMDKNYYNNCYYQYDMQKKPVNRNQSMEAVRRFRKEFGISKEDFKDEAIEKRLIENNLDINKTFQKMFG